MYAIRSYYEARHEESSQHREGELEEVGGDHAPQAGQSCIHEHEHGQGEDDPQPLVAVV